MTTSGSALIAFFPCALRAKAGSALENKMLKYAIIFAVISLVAGALGFGGVAAGAAGIAKVLFGLFLILAVIFVVLAALGVGAIKRSSSQRPSNR
jgi:uncharacterized membrane protein YtjA (UPF0391 family)